MTDPEPPSPIPPPSPRPNYLPGDFTIDGSSIEIFCPTEQCTEPLRVTVPWASLTIDDVWDRAEAHLRLFHEEP